MKILVTGGAGFVGSHLVEALSKLNYKITVLDDLSTGFWNNISEIKGIKENFIYADLTSVEQFVEEFDVIFHLAAKPFSRALKDWFFESKSIFNTNVSGTHNILRFASPNCHFIALSSAAVYGEGLNLCETSLLNPKSAYGYSKLIMEQVIKYSPRHCTILRPGTIIGARGRCFPNRLIWSTVHNEQVPIFNNGSNIRDIIDVRDVVSALIKTMKSVYGTFNLGANNQTTGKDLINTFGPIASKLNLYPKTLFTSFTPEDFVKVSTLNSNKLYNILKWKPQYSLTDSLEEITKYYLSEKIIKPPSWDSL